MRALRAQCLRIALYILEFDVLFLQVVGICYCCGADARESIHEPTSRLSSLIAIATIRVDLFVIVMLGMIAQTRERRPAG